MTREIYSLSLLSPILSLSTETSTPSLLSLSLSLSFSLSLSLSLFLALSLLSHLPLSSLSLSFSFSLPPHNLNTFSNRERTSENNFRATLPTVSTCEDACCNTGSACVCACVISPCEHLRLLLLMCSHCRRGGERHRRR
jgi:hypothetical protein